MRRRAVGCAASTGQAAASANSAASGRLIANSQGQDATDSTSEAIVGPAAKRHPHHQRIEPRPRGPGTAADRRRGIERDVHAHQRRRGDALQRAGDGQAGQAVGQGTAQRGQHVGRQPAQVHPACAQPVGQRGKRQQAAGHRQLVGIDHPDGLGRWRLQIGRDGGQRGVDDGGIERGQGDGQQHGRQGQAVAAAQAWGGRGQASAEPAAPARPRSVSGGGGMGVEPTRQRGAPPTGFEARPAHRDRFPS